MSFKLLSAAALAACLSTAAFAGDMAIKVTDSYARSASPAAKTGAAFITLMNMSDMDDRLIGVASPAAKRVELHTHIEDDGIMRMIHVKDGFPVEAGGTITMQRGGQHVMLMGLTGALEQGAMVPVTLTFEKAGAVEIMVPVDLARKPAHGGGMSGHGMQHSSDG